MTLSTWSSCLSVECQDDRNVLTQAVYVLHGMGPSPSHYSPSPPSCDFKNKQYTYLCMCVEGCSFHNMLLEVRLVLSGWVLEIRLRLPALAAGLPPRGASSASVRSVKVSLRFM